MYVLYTFILIRALYRQDACFSTVVIIPSQSYSRVNLIHELISAEVSPLPTGLCHAMWDLQFLNIIGAFLSGGRLAIEYQAGAGNCENGKRTTTFSSKPTLTW